MLKKLFLSLALAMACSYVFAQKNTNDSLRQDPIRLSAKLLDFAQNHLHIRYRAGGITPRGFDCSGFVRYCFARFGVPLPHSSAAQGLVGRDIPRAAALPGDLIFFKGHNSRGSVIGHVGIITEVTDRSIKFIHSAWKGGIRYDYTHQDYYARRFMGIKRVVGF